MKEKTQLNVLTTLRFFAASLVIFFHFRTAFDHAPWWFRGFIENGHQAVSFFFVLSGFVLTYAYFDPVSPIKLRGTMARFYVARVARIYPVYLFALVLGFPAFAYANLFHEPHYAHLFWGGLILTPLCLQAWIPQFAILWNGPAWSLSVEAFFYAVFPKISLIMGVFKRPLHCLIIAFIIFVSAFSLSILLHHFLLFKVFPNNPKWDGWILFNLFNYSPIFHFPTFFFGMALGRIFLASPTGLWFYRDSVLAASLAGLAVLFSLNGNSPEIFQSDLVLVPVYGLIIISAAGCYGMISSILSSSPLIKLGESSYAMYILHIPLWSLIFGSEPIKTVLDFVLFFILVIVVSVATFQFFESPMRRRLTKTSHRQQNKQFVLP